VVQEAFIATETVTPDAGMDAFPTSGGSIEAAAELPSRSRERELQPQRPLAHEPVVHTSPGQHG
jgi:hypothetical protein